MDVLALQVFLALALAAVLSLGGLWIHLITTFPLDDRPVPEQPRRPRRGSVQRPSQPRASVSNWRWPSCPTAAPDNKRPSRTVHIGRKEAAA